MLEWFQKNVGNLLIFREKILDLRPKSVCAVKMTFVHWTCINVNRKDVHASMISFNGKDYVLRIWVYSSVEKNETATMFFL